MRWTPDRIRTAREILGRHGTMASALREIGATLGPTPNSNLTHAFQRNHLQPPSAYLGVPPPSPAPAPQGSGLSPSLVDAAAAAQCSPPPDPVEERGHAAKARLLRGERDALLDRVRDAEARNRFADRLASPMREDPAPVRAREHASGLREATAIVLASDWHVEERVEPEAISGRNEYSLEIAHRRAARFFDGIEWLCAHHRRAFAIRDVVLWLGGDLMTGYIHPELEELNQLAPVEVTLELRRMLRAGLRQLLADPQLERLMVPCSYGNHGRTTEKKRITSGAANSFEWMLYQVLADDFADEPRVTFHAPQSAHIYVDVYGRTLHFTHGDEVRYWGGVGGLSIPLKKRLPKWDSVRRSDLHHCGHFHEFLDLGHTLVNGSLIGYNAFAQSIGAEFEPPQQAFYLLDSRRGKCMVTPVWVDDADETEGTQ